MINPKHIARLITEDPDLQASDVWQEDILAQLLSEASNLTEEEFKRSVQILTEAWLKKGLAFALAAMLPLLASCHRSASDPDLQNRIGEAHRTIKMAVEKAKETGETGTVDVSKWPAPNLAQGPAFAPESEEEGEEGEKKLFVWHNGKWVPAEEVTLK